jgi:NAD(P)-dependent dehydrogenase (short-subunit alcohol dehydrogenase family)
MVGDIDAEGGWETVRLVNRAGGHASFEAVDVRHAPEVDRFVKAAVRAHGPLAAAANVAGTHHGLGALTADVATQDFDFQMSVNLRGMWLCVRAELRAMLERGGTIVNVSSIDGLVAAEAGSPYAIAKQGILGLTRTAAVEYAQAGIRVNAICPGLIDTPLTARAWSLVDSADPCKARAQAIAQIPVRRMGSAEEIAETIAWLCTDAPAYLTGTNLVVDGGLTIRG